MNRTPTKHTRLQYGDLLALRRFDPDEPCVLADRPTRRRLEVNGLIERGPAVNGGFVRWRITASGHAALQELDANQ